MKTLAKSPTDATSTKDLKRLFILTRFVCLFVFYAVIGCMLLLLVFILQAGFFQNIVGIILAPEVFAIDHLICKIFFSSLFLI